LTKALKTYNGEKTASSTNVAEKTGYVHTENGNLIHFFTLYKYQLKVV
jgi:hypothetical protein